METADRFLTCPRSFVTSTLLPNNSFASLKHTGQPWWISVNQGTTKACQALVEPWAKAKSHQGTTKAWAKVRCSAKAWPKGWGLVVLPAPRGSSRSRHRSRQQPAAIRTWGRGRSRRLQPSTHSARGPAAVPMGLRRGRRPGTTIVETIE